MNIVILEDEAAAAKRLRSLLGHIRPDAHIVAVLETIATAREWFATHSLPDIILSDIQLGDGLAIALFAEAKINCPVIFTTAYDAYTLKAFKLNSIDYLLKPIDADELQAAFAKFESTRSNLPVNSGMHLAELLKQIQMPRETSKSRFLVKLGERLIIVPVNDVAFIRADDKVVFLHTTDGKKYLIDEPLDELSKALDPVTFFRLNRTYIAPLSSIDKIHHHFNGRLKIELKLSDDKEIFVSRARVADFKKWLNT